MSQRAMLGILGMVIWLISCGSHAQTVAQPGKPPVGAKWSSSVTDEKGSRTLTSVLTGTTTYEGKSVYQITSDANIFLIDTATLNSVALFRDGKAQWSVSPNEGALSWPLYVGKTWTGSFDYRDYAQERTFSGVTSQYRVTAFEDVTVPAGTFKAFKIEGTPGYNEAVTRTIWYAPTPGIVVKRITFRDGGRDYRNVSMRSVQELTEYPR